MLFGEKFLIFIFVLITTTVGWAAPQTYKETLVISQFQVQLQSVRYKIDDLLNISTIRKYTFNIMPEVALLNNKTGEPTKRLPDGPYIIRLTLFKGDLPQIQSGDFLQDEEAKSLLIDSSEKVAQVLGGRMISNFELDIADLAVSGTRNTLALEIYPADKKGSLEPKLHLTQFVPASESSFGIVSNYKTEINKQNPRAFMDRLISRARLEKETARQRIAEALSLTSFAQDSGLELISLTDEKLPYNLEPALFNELTNQGLVSLVPNSSKVAKLAELTSHLCRQAYLENLGFWGLNSQQIPLGRKAQYQQAFEVAQDCIKQPFKYFDFDQKIHIKHVAPEIRSLGGSSQNFNVTSNFDLSTNHALSASLRESSMASFSVGAKLLNVFRTGIGVVPLLKDIFSASVDYSMSQDSSVIDSLTQGHGHSVAFSRGLYLIEQQASFEIEITQFTSCLSILAKEEVLRPLFGNDSGVLPFRGFHICSAPQTKNISVAETYYFFSQHFASGDFLDSRNIENRPFVMSLRGVRDYLVFLNLNNAMLKANDLSEAEKSNPKDVVITGMNLFSHQQKAYPGVYSAVTKPSQLQFLNETSTNSKAKEIFSKLGKNLSPWTRKELRPLDNTPNAH